VTFTHQHLRSFVDRVCNLNKDIKTLNGDKSEVYKEAKANGFNPKVLKAAVRRFEQLKMDSTGVQEFDALFEMYMEALLGSGASDDLGDPKTPPVAPVAPAKGIQKSPTRARAETGFEVERFDPETGVLIEEVIAWNQSAECDANCTDPDCPYIHAKELPAEVPSTAEAGQGDDPPTSSVAPPINSAARAGDETAPVSGDAGENEPAETSRGRPVDISGCDASPNNSDPASDGPANSEDEAVPAVPVSSSPLSGDDPGEIPAFLKRGDPECRAA
jgi:uncharacterized protein (UPF0335 family)